MHFVSSLAWERFGEHMLRCILFSSWHARGLVNARLGTFYVLAVMSGVWSTHVEMHLSVLDGMWEVRSSHAEMYFVTSLAWEGFGQHKLR